MSERVRSVVGCMTGTSLDGLDAALVEIRGEGLSMRAAFVRGYSRAFSEGGMHHVDNGLARRLRALAQQEPMTAGEIARVMDDFADFHQCTLAYLQAPCDLLCVHGQTVFHAPPLSWQLLQPARLARNFGAPVVYDLRAADLAAGGQGAPLTPLADYVLFGTELRRRVIVNLGGFCNITRLPRRTNEPAADIEEITGMDVCACNQLLDRVAAQALGTPYDKDGAAALSADPDDAARDELFSVLNAQAAGGRSLGTGDEVGAWIDRHIGRLSGPCLARSACEGVGKTIAWVIKDGRPLDDVEVVFAGGGVHNRALMRAIGGWLTTVQSVPVRETRSLGVPTAFREAACWAVLGAMCRDGVPISLPRVTGCSRPAPVAGAWVYPPEPT